MVVLSGCTSGAFKKKVYVCVCVCVGGGGGGGGGGDRSINVCNNLRIYA